MKRMTRKDLEVGAVLAGTLLIAGGAALAWLPAGPIAMGVALVLFGIRGGV